MTYFDDANVLSESAKAQPDANVMPPAHMSGAHRASGQSVVYENQADGIGQPRRSPSADVSSPTVASEIHL